MKSLFPDLFRPKGARETKKKHFEIFTRKVLPPTYKTTVRKSPGDPILRATAVLIIPNVFWCLVVGGFVPFLEYIVLT